MQLNKLKDKKILILGFGREGQDTFLFLRKLFPKKIIGVADFKYEIPDTKYKTQNTRLHLGNNYLKALKDYDIIVKSPGIPFKVLPKSALKKIASQTEIFFDNCQGQIIGVTGTKGKSTTSSLIYHILKNGGFKVHLIGNIGQPVLSLLPFSGPKDIYVYELSSHQLYNLKKSPHIAVLLSIYPEHLDYYKSFKEYVKAKANIARYQTKNDYLVFSSQDKNVKEITKQSKAKKIPIAGDYYSLDREAAKRVGEIFKISKEIISKTIESFKELPHRLEPAGTFQGITFYNDTLATVPEATIKAIETMGDNLETIILGGYDRNISFKNLAKKIAASRIKNLILFPTTGRKIWSAVQKEVKDRGIEPKKEFFVNAKGKNSKKAMSEAVKLAYRHTSRGKICLLSPASASFGIFKDYREKGDLFKQLARQYGKKH